MHLHPAEGVELGNAIRRRLGLGHTDAAAAMDHLTLQVRQLDDIAIDDADATNASRGQVQQQR